jgi:hypothetical protein
MGGRMGGVPRFNVKDLMVSTALIAGSFSCLGRLSAIRGVAAVSLITLWVRSLYVTDLVKGPAIGASIRGRIRYHGDLVPKLRNSVRSPSLKDSRLTCSSDCFLNPDFLSDEPGNTRLHNGIEPNPQLDPVINLPHGIFGKGGNVKVLLDPAGCL